MFLLRHLLFIIRCRRVRAARWEADALMSLTSSPGSATAGPNFVQAAEMEVANLASISSPLGFRRRRDDFYYYVSDTFSFPLLQASNSSLVLQHDGDSSGSPPQHRLMEKVSHLCGAETSFFLFSRLFFSFLFARAALDLHLN